MKTLRIIERLRRGGYSLAFISRQTGVAYMRIYRFIHGEGKLEDCEHSAIESFAYTAPALKRVKK